MKYFADNKIVVTGGKGFLGTNVVSKLNEKGCQNIFIPTHNDYDLTNITDVKKMYKTFKPDIVIHLAADVGGIGYNKDNPATIYYNNICMNTIVLDEAHKAGVEKFVGMGSVCAYPKYADIPFHEESLWTGYPEETNAPYGLSKLMMLEQSRAYRMQYGFNAIHLLMINLYGPRDNFDLHDSHVIPALIHKFYNAKKNNKSVTLWGDGSATREFLYVEDAADAIVLATEKYNSPEPVNIGTGVEISIKDLSQIIADITGFSGKIEWDTSKPNGQPRRCLDVSKAEKLFNFKAKTSLVEGMKKTIGWYIENFDSIL